ncbi:MAG: ABC transporter ATP-binding protein [Kosmotoga sp.]|nr:MAG: ABC transporter ATP-binding protein [Kosmotoga sp.]
MNALEVKNLRATIGNYKIGPIDLEIPQDEIHGILGPSGCGKTVTLRTIAGLHPYDTGEIHMNGKEVTQMSPADRNLAFIFQDDAIFPHYNTYRNIAFPLEISKDKELDKKVETKAKELDGLTEYLQKRPKELPAGIKKLTALGRETVKKFNLILMDEPFERLDKKIHTEIRGMVKKLLISLGRSVLIVLTEPEDALALPDKLYIMNNGRFVAEGNPRNLYKDPPNIFVMEMLAPYGTNKLKGIIFRPEDILIDNGEKIGKINNYTLIDAKKTLAEVEVNGEVVHLLLPREKAKKEDIRFEITNYFEA